MNKIIMPESHTIEDLKVENKIPRAI